MRAGMRSGMQSGMASGMAAVDPVIVANLLAFALAAGYGVYTEGWLTTVAGLDKQQILARLSGRL